MDKINSIVAEFLNINPEELTNETQINRQALNGSIMMHRMFGEIAEAGYKIHDYYTITNFGELIAKIENINKSGKNNESSAPKKRKWFGFGS